MQYPVVLFDGECNLCRASVNFILPRDREKKFRFASLQSESGRALLKQLGLPERQIHSLVLIEEGRCFVKSTAALRIARSLSGGWALCGFFLVVPAFIRDFCYDIISRNRYRWSGRKAACLLPTPDLQERLL